MVYKKNLVQKIELGQKDNCFQRQEIIQCVFKHDQVNKYIDFIKLKYRYYITVPDKY